VTGGGGSYSAAPLLTHQHLLLREEAARNEAALAAANAAAESLAEQLADARASAEAAVTAGQEAVREARAAAEAEVGRLKESHAAEVKRLHTMYEVRSMGGCVVTG